MASNNPSVGIAGSVRSNSSIANMQNHDMSMAQKTIAGSPLAIDKVVATSTTATPVKNLTIARVVNRSSSVQYLWAGREDLAPATVTASNGIALPPNSVENFCLPSSNDPAKAIVIKSSDAQVHIVIMAG